MSSMFTTSGVGVSSAATMAISSIAYLRCLAKKLRVGQHSGKVRFVIETADNLSSQVRTRPAGETLIVELLRR